MSDSNRGVVAAFAGIAALTTAAGFGAFYGSIHAPNNRHYQTIGPNSGQNYPADSPRNGLADVSGIDSLIESAIAKPKPRNTNEREQRDLAAQESMAVFAYWMFWAMVLQTTLAAGALIALIKDLRQNRRAAEIQLRAYVTGEPKGVFEHDEDGEITVPVYLRNDGQTPARNVAVESVVFLSSTPIDLDPDALIMQLALRESDMTIPPAEGVHIYIASGRPFTETEMASVRDKKMAITHVGVIAYDDVFGVRQETRFAHYHWGEHLTPENSRNCRFGNRAT